MSTMKHVSLEDAELHELKWFAEHRCALPDHALQANVEPDKLRAMIRTVFDGNDIEVPNDLLPAPSGRVVDADMSPALEQAVPGTTKAKAARKGHFKGMVDKSSEGDPKVTIHIPRQSGPGGDRHVPVSVNGRLMLIPRARNVEIPYRYYEALNNAIEARYEEVPARGDQPADMKRTDVHSYPFHVLRMPAAAEVEAWIRHQDAEGLIEQQQIVAQRRRKEELRREGFVA